MASSVTVNGEAIPESRIREEMAALRASLEAQGEQLTLERRLQLRDEATESLIERKLVFQEACRLKLNPSAAEIGELAATLLPRVDGAPGCRAGVDPEVVNTEAERRLVLERMLAWWGRNVKPPQMGEIREYYRAHQAEMHRPECVRASHIVKHNEGANPEHNREALQDLRARLLAGEDFAVLAAAHSDCPERGGDLGLFPRGVMVEEFDAVVFDAPLGEPTPVFETRFGMHIALVYERLPEGTITLNEALPRIAEALQRTKHDQEVGRRLAVLRRNATVEIV